MPSSSRWETSKQDTYRTDSPAHHGSPQGVAEHQQAIASAAQEAQQCWTTSSRLVHNCKWSHKSSVRHSSMSRMRWPPTKLQPSICKPCSMPLNECPSDTVAQQARNELPAGQQAVVDTQANLNRAQQQSRQVQEVSTAMQGATEQLNTIAHETQGNLEPA